jgi:simple sugar transport system permease protein
METTYSSIPNTQYFMRRYGALTIFGIVVLAFILFFYLRDPQSTTAVLASTVRHSTPLVLGALCGLLSERSGVINIGIEGMMLLSAFMAYMFNVWTGNLLFAALGGILTGVVMGALLAFMSVTLKLDQIIGGSVINIVALGLTGYFYQTGLTTSGKLRAFALGPLAEIPLIGPVLFDNPPITYMAIVLVFIIQFVLFRTRWGLRTRAVGEHPRAADTVGINVYFMRYANVILGGAIAGLAGAFLTLEAVGSFERNMTNGRGFIALAVMLFGKYNPIGAWGAALFFGFTTAMQTQLQFMGFNIPHQFIGMIPYVMTILVLAGFVGRTRVPAADGVPYEKE